MTTKDFRVVCAIIASTVDYFGLPEEEENLILDDAKRKLADTYTKFEPELFDKLYESEKNDIELAKEEQVISEHGLSTTETIEAPEIIRPTGSFLNLPKEHDDELPQAEC